MKKKYSASTKDKKDWVNFTKEMGNIAPKESDPFKQDIKSTKIRKLDLKELT